MRAPASWRASRSARSARDLNERGVTARRAALVAADVCGACSLRASAASGAHARDRRESRLARNHQPGRTAQIRARSADPERRTNKTARRYLLARLLVCSHCGERSSPVPAAGGSAAMPARKDRASRAAARPTSMRRPSRRSSSRPSCTGSTRPSSPRALPAARQRSGRRALARRRSNRRSSSSRARAPLRRPRDLEAELLAARKPIEQRADQSPKSSSPALPHQRACRLLGNSDALREPTGRARRSASSTRSSQPCWTIVVVGPAARRGYNRFDAGLRA